MPDFSDVPDGIERLLRDVDHGATSTTKYRQFERYLAEVLGIPAASIYTTHVAKPGNFDVRMTQSGRARNARLRVALLPRDADLWYIVDFARRIARNRYPGTAVLLICDRSGRWTPRWGVEPEVTEQSSDSPANLFHFRGWFSDFLLETYPHVPAEDHSAGQEQLEALLADWNESLSLLPGLPEPILREIFARSEVIQRLYRLDPSLFARLIESDTTARDVVAIEHRRTVVDRFRRLLEHPQFFSKAAEEFGGRKEAVWQKLLEENPWILGVSLTGQLLTNWDEDKLEQVVAGFSISGRGKRADALMHTSGRIRALIFAEIKHHETHLLGAEYRDEAWAPSLELSGGVAQAQKTVHRAAQEIGERLPERDESGADTGEHTYLVRPRSFLILGNLEELRGQSGVHRAKYESFELYRRNLHEPEIVTFDELLARAEWHVEVLDEDHGREASNHSRPDGTE